MSKTNESWKILYKQCEYVNTQILSLTTELFNEYLSSYRSHNPKFSLLSNTDRIFDNLACELNNSISMLLDSVDCLRVSSTVKDYIGDITKYERKKGIFFSLLIANKKLIHINQNKLYSLYPSDIHLLINTLSIESLREGEVLFNIICLPHLKPRGYLVQHVTCLSPNIFLILLSTNNEIKLMEDLKEKIQKAVIKVNLLKEIGHYDVKELNIEGLLHFVYNYKKQSTMTAPILGHPYKIKNEKKRLYYLYQTVINRLHDIENPHRVIFYKSKLESIIGWNEEAFELYAIFNPLISKKTAIKGCNAILKWIQQHDQNLFITPILW